MKKSEARLEGGKDKLIINPKPNDSFVRIYNKALPQAICKKLISKFEKLREEGDQVDSRGRLTSDLFLTKGNQFDDELPVIQKVQRENYVNKYQKDFPLLYYSPVHRARYWKLRRVEIGDHYSSRGWHYEQQTPWIKEQGCIVSSMFYLNDVAKGGETELPYQGIKVKPEAGKLIFFPSSYTHVHRGIPPKSNVKYILVSFLYFDIIKEERKAE